MKSFKYIISIALLTIIASCTEVVDVDVPEVAPRLVVEASINWVKGTIGNEQLVKLSTSTPFFDGDSFQPAIGASVSIINNSDGMEFFFNDQDNGDYTINNFFPILNQEYTLDIEYNGDMYTATETLVPVSEINNITQEEGDGFDEDETIIEIFFDDPVDEINFYYASFQTPSRSLLSLDATDDDFFNGNEISLEYEEELNEGDIIDINLFGISEGYYNYLELLLAQTDGDQGPFPTTPSEVKGNCVNLSNSDNYAFGFFRLSETSSTIYTVTN
mgnify:CR=1 FL=1